MRIDKEKIKAIAKPLDEDTQKLMQARKADRDLNSASAAIAAKILRRMRIIGKSRVELAEDLGITPANITRYLSGRCNFELRTIVDLERILKINIIDRNIIPDQKSNKVVLLTVQYSENRQDKFISPRKVLLDLHEYA